MTDIKANRRKVLLAGGAALTIGLAGCLGDDDDNGNGNGNDEVSLEDHLENANGYDGFEDHTGEDEVTVTVTSDNGNSYDPAAIEIDSGTTVVWEWVDDGHSVTHVGGEFDSDILNTGDEFEHTFDDAGDYAYECIPHVTQGHLGGVRVHD